MFAKWRACFALPALSLLSHSGDDTFCGLADKRPKVFALDFNALDASVTEDIVRSGFRSLLICGPASTRSNCLNMQ